MLRSVSIAICLLIATPAFADDVSGYYVGWIGKPTNVVELRLIEPRSRFGAKAVWLRVSAPRPGLSGSAAYTVEGGQ